MELKALNNGVKIYLERTSSPTVTVQAQISVGSGNETKDQQGYAHFVEHVIFEGTKKRTNFDIANEVESVGGELNGATSADRTYYYLKLPAIHAQRAVDIMADILQNSTFLPKIFKKEKTVILSEIDMYHDDPKLLIWVLLEEKLFNTALGMPTLGTRDSISHATRKNLLKFYNTHYVGGNITVAISGNLPKLNLKAFSSIPQGITEKSFNECPLTKDLMFSISRTMNQSYLNIGYKTVSRSHKDSVALDVIYAILGRGVSGRLFDELRNKRGLGYALHVYHDPMKDTGMFGVVISVKKKDISLVERIVKKEFKLSKVSSKELREAKDYVLGSLSMDMEDTRFVADNIVSWSLYASISDMNKYKSRVKKVSLGDIRRCVNSYFKYKLMINIVEK